MASAYWQARNARARAAGYRSYYDYRTHEYGRRPPSEPPARGARLAELRGHRSAADLAAAIRTGRVEMVLTNTSRRDARGRITEIEVQATMADGSRRTYTLKGNALKQRQLSELQEALASGPETMLTVGSPGGRKVLGGADVAPVYVFERRGRYFVGFDKAGRAMTSPDTDRAVQFPEEGDDEQEAIAGTLRDRGFDPVEIDEAE